MQPKKRKIDDNYPLILTD